MTGYVEVENWQVSWMHVELMSMRLNVEIVGFAWLPARVVHGRREFGGGGMASSIEEAVPPGRER
jgi:hypothetical protein